MLGDQENTLTGAVQGPKVASRSEDVWRAWDISGMDLGDYEVRISLSEVGDPWEQNVWDAVYIINIVRVV